MNTERNGNQFKANKTISISTMTFKPKGNGADNNSLKTYKVLRLGDVAYEGHTNNEFAYGRFVLNDIGDGIMSPRFSCLRPLKVQNILFWKEYIHSELVMRNILVRSTKKGTMMNELVSEDFLRNKIKVPSSREQECIGSLFRCLDSLIAAAERKARLLRKKKHAYLNHIFTQHLRFTGHTTPWQTKKLGNIADIVGGGTPSTIRPEYWDGGIQWFTPAEITKAQTYVSNSTKTITELGLSKSSARLLPGNRTILFTSRASIGETALLTVDATTNQGFQSIVLKDGINRYFIYCMVSNLRRYAQRMASGSTFLEISNHQLAKAPVYIPDSSEQAEIARFFQTLDSLIAAAERKANLLKKKKQAYLQKMFI